MNKVSILLENLAKHFASPDNEILKEAENDENILHIVASAFVNCAHELSNASMDVLKFEPHIDAEDLTELAAVAEDFDKDEELTKYSDSIDNILNLLSKKENLDDDLDNAAKLASVLDNSGDDKLQKIASVLDEILLTIGAPKGAVQNIKSAEEAEIEKLREKYRKPSPDFFTPGNEPKQKLADEYNKEIEDKIKVYKPMEAPLSARACPDHAGVMLMRVGDHVSQCPLDKKIYNYETGYTLMDGSKIPASSVQNQTANLADHAVEHVSFSNREQRLNDMGN